MNPCPADGARYEGVAYCAIGVKDYPAQGNPYSMPHSSGIPLYTRSGNVQALQVVSQRSDPYIPGDSCKPGVLGETALVASGGGGGGGDDDACLLT